MGQAGGGIYHVDQQQTLLSCQMLGSRNLMGRDGNRLMVCPKHMQEHFKDEAVTDQPATIVAKGIPELSKGKTPT